MSLLSGFKPKTTGTKNEERRSFGIGGAGNIRTRDQAVVHGEYDLFERRQSRVGRSNTDPVTGGATSAGRRSSSISETLKRTFTSKSK